MASIYCHAKRGLLFVCSVLSVHVSVNNTLNPLYEPRLFEGFDEAGGLGESIQAVFLHFPAVCLVDRLLVHYHNLVAL